MLKKLFKNQLGFTLIEAIISIAIVGIVVAPISAIYFGSLQQSIEAKDKLRASELAQLYIENIKERSYDDFMDIYSAVSGSSITITATDFGGGNYFEGFPNVSYMDDYRVTIEYDQASTDYAEYALTQAAVQFDDFDVTIDIDSSATYGIVATYNNGVNQYFFTDDGTMDITINSSFLLIDSEFNTVNVSSNAIQINCNADITDIAQITFNIKNETSNDSSIYIYRQDDTKVEAIVNSLEGRNYRNYNLNNYSTDVSTGIFIIEVTIEDVMTNEELAHVYATKIYE
jgi:prepilin-type N-terminal cleavage/methylation domain-containing protein